MADITGLNGSGSTSLLDIMNKDNSSGILDTSYGASTTLLNSTRKQSQSAYNNGLPSSLVQAALNRALSEMDSSGGRITYADIAAYQKQLEKEFSLAMVEALAKEGISSDTQFSLSISPEGAISVNCTDQAAREKIEKYLEENPEVREQFSYIQALSNLDRAVQRPTSWGNSLRGEKIAMQASAIEAFFGDSLNSGMNVSSLLASFGLDSDQAKYYSGIDYLV